jgi:hypothetical protein
LGFKKVADSKCSFSKEGPRRLVTKKSEIWSFKENNKVYFVRIDQFGNDGDPAKYVGAKKRPHYHIDSCDSTKPATHPIRDSNGRPIKNPDGTWKTTTDPSMTQDQHYLKEWEPSAINYDVNGNPVHPGDKDWAIKTHI